MRRLDTIETIETTIVRSAVAEPPPDEEAGHAFLIIHDGAGDKALSRVLEIPDGGELTIGRAREAALPVVDDQVSRQHARITREGGDILIEDLGSVNGTFVNGSRIEGSARLASGDEIAVGNLRALVGVTSELARSTRIGSLSALEDRLEAETDRALRFHRPFALLMFRLDGAPEAERAALYRVARWLRRMDFLADYGGDEFAALLPETDAGAAAAAAIAIAREARIAGVASGTVTVHVGLAVCPRDGAKPGRLVARARAALRAARSGLGFEGVSSAPPADGEQETLIAHDPQMRRVLDQVDKVARSNLTVLILGETGSGKEMVAHELHRRSDRRDGPFVRLNCAALTETLLESELFGHEKGAFTGAQERKAGYFEVADGGTILLDEIGEMPLRLQAKLLRVLEQRCITRVGGTSEVNVDVRIVCATNRDLEAEVRAGRFREDLFYRISVFTVVIPPLRDRPGEIERLAEHFAARLAPEGGAARLGAGAMQVLRAHDWPGNVRELRNAIERAVVLAGGGTIEPEHLPDSVLRVEPEPIEPPAGGSARAPSPLDEVERDAIAAALAQYGGNQTRTAEMLGITRRALIYRMKKFGIGRPDGDG